MINYIYSIYDPYFAGKYVRSVVPVGSYQLDNADIENMFQTLRSDPAMNRLKKPLLYITIARMEELVNDFLAKKEWDYIFKKFFQWTSRLWDNENASVGFPATGDIGRTYLAWVCHLYMTPHVHMILAWRARQKRLGYFTEQHEKSSRITREHVTGGGAGKP